MGALLLTVLALCLLVAAGFLLVVLVVLVPFLLAAGLAERRGFSAWRWGAASLTGTALMIVLVAWQVKAEQPKPILLPALVLWIGPPLAAGLLRPSDRTWAGVPGAHQR